MARYIILDAQGCAVNCIEWDGITKWQPPDGCTVRPEKEDEPFGYGWREDLQTGKLCDPSPPIEVKPVQPGEEPVDLAGPQT